MPPFEFLLKNEKQKLYERFVVFVFILNGLAILYFFLRTKQNLLDKPSLVVMILSIVAIVLYFILPRVKKREKNISFFFAAAALSFYWAWSGYTWLAILLISLITLYLISKRELRVIVSNDHVIYPSFPKRVIEWNELSNLLLKDGLLTIDFRNNRIIQQLTSNQDQSVNEREFNDFCRQQLNK
jgi:membrane protease YdiL (CAAX protease family)